MNKKAIILLSGGLDSVVSLAMLRNDYDFALALMFNYGQKSFQKEFVASKKIAEYYDVKHECVKLDFLKNITNTSLVSGGNVPSVDVENLNNFEVTSNSMKNVWVPNRNGLFLNIAGAYADSYKYDYIIIGANKEEATTFSDNSIQFIDDINKSLVTATNHDIKVLAPLVMFDKNEIVKKALELDVPLNLISSCYSSVDGHCGECESCNRLKRALEYCGCDKIKSELFK